MFTVLIAEKEHIDAIKKENKLFFEPFLENKEIAFCNWNPMGQNLKDSVPGLLDTVGRRKEWRAVIINSCTEASLKQKNPFDIVDDSAINALVAPPQQFQEGESVSDWEESWEKYYSDLMAAKEEAYKSALEQPLQKLVTWLCFRPEDYIHNDVEEKLDVHDWAIEMIGKEEVKSGEKLELMERSQYKRELRFKETLRRTFVNEMYLNVNYPSEVYCISPRSSETNLFDPDTIWGVRQDSQYSTFTDRNMYFDRMRFMVFDVLPKTHRDFRSDYIRFLATVLIFVSNHVPGSAMQARRLYRLTANADDTPLCTLITSYDKKLASTFEVIDIEMEKIRSEIPGELSDKTAAALFCTPIDVPVILDESCETDKVYAEKDYGLFYDSPENEFHKWNRDYLTSINALSYIAKQQSRSIRKSVSQMHCASEISNVNISRLTPLQIDDVREFTEAAENTMVSSIPSDMTDISLYTDRLAEESENVKDKISRRMTKKTTIALSLICMFLYLICFFPFLFANNGTAQTVSTAVVLIAVSLGLLAAVLVAALVFLRRSVVNAVQRYNSTAHDILNDVQASMKQFSQYLSASSNVRRGHTVQNYAQKNVDEYTKNLRIRRRHQESIRKTRAQIAEGYGDYLCDRTFCDETMSRPYDYDFDQPVEYTYPAPFLAGDSRQIEFLCRGNYVTVPLSYVTGILVEMEEIYEK